MNDAQPDAPPGKEIITVGGGCFWCTEAVFDMLNGVEKVESGYSGGSIRNPTYREVCGGDTGHAEVVQITFDPRVLPLGDLLSIFLTTHDPTTPNRQGADVGTQYRSVIFHRTEAQKRAAEEAIRKMEAAKIWDDPIVTEIAPFEVFYPAEQYHQEYFARNPAAPYCQVVIAPKVAKAREAYRERLKPG
jgi:peptide-methionine (S)-S-oxide reductase